MLVSKKTYSSWHRWFELHCKPEKKYAQKWRVMRNETLHAKTFFKINSIIGTNISKYSKSSQGNKDFYFQILFGVHFVWCEDESRWRIWLRKYVKSIGMRIQQNRIPDWHRSRALKHTIRRFAIILTLERRWVKMLVFNKPFYNIINWIQKDNVHNLISNRNQKTKIFLNQLCDFIIKNTNCWLFAHSFACVYSNRLNWM